MLQKVILYILFGITVIGANAQQKPELIVPQGHVGRIRSIDISPCEKYFVTAGGKAINIWDFASKMVVRTYSFPNQIRTVKYSPDNSYIIAGSEGSGLIIIDLDSISKPPFFVDTIKFVTSICFFNKENSFVVSSMFGDLFFFDSQNFSLIKTINIKKIILSVDISPNDSLLIVGTNKKTVDVVNLKSNELVASLEGMQNEVSSVSFSPDGKEFAGSAGSFYNNSIEVDYENPIIVWETKTLTEKFRLNGHKRSVNAFTFSSNGKNIISGCNDKKIRFWNLDERSIEKTINLESSFEDISLFPVKNKFLFATRNGEIVQVDCISGNKESVFSGKVNELKEIVKTSNQNIILINAGNSVRELNLINGKIRNITPENSNIFTFSLSPDEKSVVTASFGSNNALQLWNRNTGELLREFIGHGDLVEVIIFSNNGKFLASGSRDSTIIVWDINSGKQEIKLSGHQKTITALSFSPDDRFIYSASSAFPSQKNERFSAKRWDLKTGKYYNIQSADSVNFVDIDYCQNQNILIGLSSKGTFIWDANSCKLKRTLNKSATYYGSVSFDKNQRKLLIGGNGSWTINGISEKNSNDWFFHYSNYIVFSAEFDYSETRVIYSTMDNRIRIHNLINNEEIASILLLINNEWVAVTPDNYFYCEKSVLKLLGYKIGIKAFPFEQFDLKYNRPDIVLERLGYADSSLIAAYHQAYLKRLKKMNFTEDMLKDDFHIPEIKIENFEEMPAIIKESEINLDLNMNDSKYPLDRVNIWVNNVAVYGTNGISLRDKKVKEYKTKTPISLARGENKVQISVLNQAGAESYKETFYITCEAGKEKPNLYLITLGGSKYQNESFNLTYASKDAKDVAGMFEKSPVFEKVFTKTLTNDQLTKDNIIGLKEFLSQADINDHVIIFLAGHGVLDENLDYYLATYDMDFNNPEEKGLPYDELENLLDGIKPLKKILMMDACHSGEIDKEEVQLIAQTETSNEEITFRTVGNSPAPKLGSQNTSELTRSLFADIRKGTGATVISAAGGMEFAMESPEWHNGLFTYCLLNGLQSKAADLNGDGIIMLSELQKYVQDEVSKLSGGKQQPTSRIENLEGDFRVW